MSLFLVLALIFQQSNTPLTYLVEPQEIISNVQVSYMFGETATVQAQLSPYETVDHVTLVFRPENGTQLQEAMQMSSLGVLTAQVNLQNKSIRAMDKIYYWFIVVNNDGSIYTSPSYWFDYQDNRYDWQKTESKWFKVYTTPDNSLSGDQIQAIALEGLKNATAVLPVSPGSLPIQIFVYPTPLTLKSALGISEQDWIAAKAKPKTGTIFVSESGGSDDLQQISVQIPHELTHLLEYSVTNGNYDFVPSWLLEGLAMNAEASLSKDDTTELQRAYRNNNLIPLDQLCNSFPSDAAETSLAYIESASFVEYLSSTYGTEKIIGILNDSQYGVTCSDLSTRILGKDLGTLQKEWLSVTFTGKTVHSLVDYWPILLLIPIILLILFLVRKQEKVKF